MTYPGGKNGSGVYQTIINLMPPHSTYIEGFLGGGAIMRLKKPATCSIGIDSDGDVLSQWRGDEVPGLILLHGDALEFLCSTFPGDTLIYLDPPYVMETRSCQRPLYRHEFSDEQHQQLLSIIKRLGCMVMLSGYYSDLYAEALRDWRTVTFQAQTRSATATEWIWLNFPEPFELHDYKFLGRNFRERERIKRKKLRWKGKLLRMKPLERNAILMALEEIRELASPKSELQAATPNMTMGAPTTKYDDGRAHHQQQQYGPETP